MSVLARVAAGRLAAARAVIPCLWRGQYFSSGKEPAEDNSVTPMLRHLIYKIKSTGPITVAEYMREVLTNPAKGYYVTRDMLGEKGDFITSPEISQIFGELLGIWFISEWIATGKNAAFQLVELGPGRGTLSGDILRVFSQLGSVLKNCDISIHLVEVSQKLSEIQALTLTEEKVPLEREAGSPVYMKGVTKSGIPISWYRDLQDVPKGYSFYLAHEFFDVLPVHKFQKTPQGWREVLIDIDPQVSDKLRFVLAPCATPAEAFIQKDETRDHVEVCPDAGVIIQELAQRISLTGGAALIADYGHDGTKTDTFRGFCGHQLHDVLIAPGTADLTADVDFSYLRRMSQGKVASLGPISQQTFLRNMGIDVRLKILLDKSDEPSLREQLLQGYRMLMNPEKMGERFNFFALVPHQRLHGRHHQMNACQSKPSPSPVAGFGELVWR
ncbi:protein arginine methyltransferase NDUFAF7, mitochondrial isoform X1 [Sus scrofa]|uniref:Protein arginine methyltransferase NDUFAF7 n=3 Tax=Sus scrofa TaxID=9823 RepID=A0A8D0MZV6_PIG|nr:protein arginine methyltransferase NDUFAF7, mitochondrial isoform X2 [Sus scrofa]XP_020943289.1 protein arginine methyltransferase NDUFAF7, mitochondrial isoform X1 [Sus scrofa]